MRYRFYGDTLQLVKYEVTIEHEFERRERVINEDTQETEYITTAETHTETFMAVTDEERDELLVMYPEATVTEIDNTGYEWLDGMVFTQGQRSNGELQRAIELGQEAYEKSLLDSDPTLQIVELKENNEILQDALLELAEMISGVMSND